MDRRRQQRKAIENYLGFPKGLSGAELSQRAIAQTLRFGTEILTPKTVKNIRLQDGYKIIEMSDGTEVNSKAIVIANGVEYRTLEVPVSKTLQGQAFIMAPLRLKRMPARMELFI